MLALQHVIQSFLRMGPDNGSEPGGARFVGAQLAQYRGGGRMAYKRDTQLLRVYDSLPPLLDLAHERIQGQTENVYRVQDALRSEYRQEKKPFRWSMLYRSLDSCPQCSYTNTVIHHVLENPAVLDASSPWHHADISELEVHGIREHHVPFPGQCRAFLEHLEGQPDR
jgi:hypothetical protein